MIISLKSLWTLARINEAAANLRQPLPLDVLHQARMPALQRFHANKMIAAIQAELAALEAMRIDLVRQHGKELLNEQNECTGYTVEHDPAALQAFQADIDALCAGTVEIPGELLSLADITGVSLSGLDLEALHFLFRECAEQSE